jgi:hypothetical protein
MGQEQGRWQGGVLAGSVGGQAAGTRTIIIIVTQDYTAD